VRLPAPPNPWRKPALKKQQLAKAQGDQQQAMAQQQDEEEGAKVKSEPGDQEQGDQQGQEGGATAAASGTKPPAQQQPQQQPTDAQQPQQQQQQQQGGFQQLTAKQRRQLKRRQELAARAAERDSLSIARAACLSLVEKKLSLQDKPLDFDATMEQVSRSFLRSSSSWLHVGTFAQHTRGRERCFRSLSSCFRLLSRAKGTCALCAACDVRQQGWVGGC
jgi:hypothetical protein